MNKFIERLHSIDNKWFYSDLPGRYRFFLFFIRGDLIILFPFLLIILFTGIFSLRFMITLLGVFYTVRYLGEMIYWFGQQFSDRKYRPNDFGFKKLDNNAIYIIYQTIAIVNAVIGLGVILFCLYFWQ